MLCLLRAASWWNVIQPHPPTDFWLMEGWVDGLIFVITVLSRMKSGCNNITFTETALLLCIVVVGVVRLIDMKRRLESNLTLSCCTKLLLTLDFQALLDHPLYCPPWNNKVLFSLFWFFFIVQCGIMSFKQLRKQQIHEANLTYAQILGCCLVRVIKCPQEHT